MPRILIVEDDAALLRGLVDNFSSEGYETLVAIDGVKGLDLLLEKGPDIVLLDVMLPGVSGFEICSAARREGCDMPIIMLTAKGQESDVVRGLETGADDYVTKPFSIRELIARVHAFLRRHKAMDEWLLPFAQYRLDRKSCRLLKGEGEIRLARKEYLLLEYFLLNEGKALTRQSIMNNVWGSSVLVTQRSVDRCVTTLRSKIETDVKRPRLIQTVRDVGYRFEGSRA